jgi:LysR family transcriptional regulator, benzoate and cis,cis-muconate-responsive activator of ben and cat genes
MEVMPIRHHHFDSMELRHLRYFQAVAEELSFSRASRRLHIAQPALSRAVRELEEDLQVLLLERNKHQVRLTPPGEVLLQEIAILIERLEESIRRVKRTAQGTEGELRLGYVGPPTAAFLGRLLHEYRRLYPLVTVHLEERTPERVWEMVAKGRLSAGLTRPVPATQDLGLRTVVLREERLGAVVRSDHAWASKTSVTWKSLAQESLLLLARREGASLHDAILLGCRQAGFIPKIAHTPSLIGTVLTYVDAGAGIGIVTDSIVKRTHSLRFLPLTPAQTVPLVFVWQEDTDAPPLQRWRELLLSWKKDGQLWPQQ